MILKQFSDPRFKGHIRLPAATCQFGMSENQTSCVVVQVADETASSVTEIVRSFEVATVCHNSINKSPQGRVAMRELAFPSPDMSVARTTMKYEYRIIIDLGGDLLTTGFARDVSAHVAWVPAVCALSLFH